MNNQDEQFDQNQRLIDQLQQMKQQEFIHVDTFFKTQLREHVIAAAKTTSSAAAINDFPSPPAETVIIDQPSTISTLTKAFARKWNFVSRFVPVFLLLFVVIFSLKNLYFEKNNFESTPEQTTDLAAEQEIQSESTNIESIAAVIDSPAPINDTEIIRDSSSAPAQVNEATKIAPLLAEESAPLEKSTAAPPPPVTPKTGASNFHQNTSSPTYPIEFQQVAIADQPLIVDTLIVPLIKSVGTDPLSISVDLNSQGHVGLHFSIDDTNFHYWYQKNGHNWQSVGAVVDRVIK